MTGETKLTTLLRNMSPELFEEDYVFASVRNLPETLPLEQILCFFREKEGITLVLSKSKADALGLPYQYIASRITLNIHSALEAVGLTAAFATALAKENISCNVIAGYYHDHLFVDQKDAQRAMAVLKSLSQTESS